MSAAPWLTEILAWKPATKNSERRCRRLFDEAIAPNIADVGSSESLALAGAAYRSLGITRQTDATLSDDTARDTGASLEQAVELDLRDRLAELDAQRRWHVRRGGYAYAYAQFEHLQELQRLFEAQPTLRATVGHDYLVKSDVYVGLPGPNASTAQFLHAAISCKWTIRSDRVQNVRHEFNTLVRSRRGRLPHLALVTAEPLPSRVISIARGTGEVDAVYHLLFDELSEAVNEIGSPQQREDWDEMCSQRRLRSYAALARDLTLN